MSAQIPRISLRTAGLTVAAAGTALTGAYIYSQKRSPFRTVYAEAPAKPGPKTMKWSGFTELKLESAELINHNVKRLRFALPDDETVSGLAPVSSYLTQHTPDGAWIPVFRPYTPISGGNDSGHITFIIKKYPNGKASGKFHSLVPGDTMKFKPLPEFEYKANQFSAMTFIAGGSGITPLYQLARTVLDNPEDTTKIAMVYAANTEEDLLLRTEFDDLEAKYPGRFSATYTVSKPSPNKDAKINVGYVNKETLQKIMPDPKTEKAIKVLVSGPPVMTEAVAGAKGGFGWTQGSVGGILKELGYTKDDVHKFG